MLKGLFVFLSGLLLVIVPFLSLSRIWFKGLLVILGLVLVGLGYAITNNFFRLQIDDKDIEERKVQ